MRQYAFSIRQNAYTGELPVDAAPFVSVASKAQPVGNRLSGQGCDPLDDFHLQGAVSSKKSPDDIIAGRRKDPIGLQ
jgi:hypothetical protein